MGSRTVVGRLAYRRGPLDRKPREWKATVTAFPRTPMLSQPRTSREAPSVVGPPFSDSTCPGEELALLLRSRFGSLAHSRDRGDASARSRCAGGCAADSCVARSLIATLQATLDETVSELKWAVENVPPRRATVKPDKHAREEARDAHVGSHPQSSLGRTAAASNRPSSGWPAPPRSSPGRPPRHDSRRLDAQGSLGR